MNVRRLFLILAVFVAGSVQADVLVRVRPHVVAQPDTDVKLVQLIDAPGLSDEGRSRLAAISISKAPAFGDKQNLQGTALMPLLRPVIEAERSKTQAKVHVVLPKNITIDTVRREMDAGLVTMELMQAWQPLCSDCQLSIEGLSLPKVDTVRDWTLKVKAELPRGSFSVPVDLIKENGQLLPAWVSGRLVTKRKVPVAKKVMAPGERVQPGDVAWEFRDTAYAYDGIPSAEEISGKRLRLGLRAGDVLWRSQLEKEKAVRRGDLVQVRSGSGAWEVALSVVAQQDAYIGDVVNLKNPKTNSTLTGEVVGQGEVELR